MQIRKEKKSKEDILNEGYELVEKDSLINRFECLDGCFEDDELKKLLATDNLLDSLWSSLSGDELLIETEWQSLENAFVEVLDT